jgi:dipeptidyl aminopeptidase/acylaminoacyl peptidase
MKRSWLFRPLSFPRRAAVGVLFVLLAAAFWWFLPLVPRARLPAGLSVLKVSPDGRFLATRQGGRVVLWDVATGHGASEVPGDLSRWEMWEFTFSANGCFLAASGDGLLKVWEAPAGRAYLSVPVSANQRFRSGPLFSPDGRWLAFRDEEAGGAQRLRVWDLEQNCERAVLPGPRVESLHFSPDGTKLVFENWEPTPGRTPVGRIRLWDAETGAERPALEDGTGPLRVLAFAPDGRSLASGERRRWQWAGSHRITLWDLGSGRQRGAWEVPRGVTALRFSADGARLLCRGSLDGVASHMLPELSLIELAAAGEREIAYIPSVGSISPDARLLACCDRWGDDVTILELPAEQERARLTPRRTGERLDPRDFTADGKLLAVTGTVSDPPPHPLLDWLRGWFGGKKTAPVPSLQEADLHLFATDTGAWQGTVPVIASTGTWFTPDGKTLIVIGPEQAPTLWDLPLRKPWGRLGVLWALLAGYFVALWWGLRGRKKAALREALAGPGAALSE